MSTYVESAGVEIAAAASGLASVKSSLPPRDTRPIDKRLKPEALPAAKQAESDPDYAQKPSRSRATASRRSTR
ncbi:hypothetical protein [Streptomyces sp. KL116D]|uniref:hypothetical protein n=1 Tax=Streptomyces sp. KL116D TaxID=3045152 RepID=UPI003555EBB6